MRLHDRAPNPPSLALACAGFVVVGTTFLLANPWVGVHERWPWESFARLDGLLAKTLALLWFATGVLAILLALGKSWGARTVILGFLTTILVVALHSHESLFAVTSARLLDGLLWTALLGAGLLATTQEEKRHVGRTMAGVGGALLLIYHFLSVDPLHPHMARLHGLIHDIGVWMHLGADAVRPDRLNHIWFTTLPDAALVFVAVLGCLVGLRLVGKRFAWFGFVLLLLLLVSPWIVQSVARTWPEFAKTELRPERTPGHFVGDAVRMLVNQGTALWMLLTAILFDAVPKERAT